MARQFTAASGLVRHRGALVFGEVHFLPISAIMTEAHRHFVWLTDKAVPRQARSRN